MKIQHPWSISQKAEFYTMFDVNVCISTIFICITGKCLNFLADLLLLMFHIIYLLNLIKKKKAFQLSFVPICSCQFIDILNSLAFHFSTFPRQNHRPLLFLPYIQRKEQTLPNLKVFISLTRKNELDRQKIAHFLSFTI